MGFFKLKFLKIFNFHYCLIKLLKQQLKQNVAAYNRLIESYNKVTTRFHTFNPSTRICDIIYRNERRLFKYKMQQYPVAT